VESSGGGGGRGKYISITDYYGFPALAYYDDTDNDLRFARGYVP
jgi:hypothetical protein